MAFLKEWDAGVHEKFKGNDSVNIHHWLTSFDDRMDTSKNFAGYTSPPLPKCNCRVESDWCGIGMACIREKCDVGFPMGCGWFSLFPCDGICDWPWKRKPEPGATAASNTAPSPH